MLSVERLTRMYLKRIEAYEEAGPGINAYLHVNENALREARQLDALNDRHHRRPSRKPLFGIPVLLKDNIDTADMPTTAGSVALAGSLPPDDAFITRKLRNAGAIILGKGTLTEYANFIAIGMPTGYSSLGGFGFNPYDPRVDPRTEPPNNDGRPVLQTGGSSSGPGIGVNANLVDDRGRHGDVGIDPEPGERERCRRHQADGGTGEPRRHHSDHRGSGHCRTDHAHVTDAAILLGVLAGFDPNDPATAACLKPGNCFQRLHEVPEQEALRGARLAVPPVPANRQALMDAAIAVLRAQGATVELIDTYDARIGVPQLGTCVARPLPTDLTCSTVLLYGFKRDLNAYLAATPAAPSRTLAEIIAFNNTFVPPMKYGQAIAIGAEALDVSAGSADTARYVADRAEDLRRSKLALDGVFNGAGRQAGDQQTTSTRSCISATPMRTCRRRRAIRASRCPAASMRCRR